MPPGSVVLVLGGTRSGKSREAQELAQARAGPLVAFIATARRGEDRDFDRRIERHRASRRADWQTIEGADDLVIAIQAVDPRRLLLIDSLALWVAAVLERGATIDATWPRLEHALRSRVAGVVLVSDEVGLGPIARTALGRRFVDALGEANQRAAAMADEVCFVTAGLAQRLKP
ncbi:MAG: bifunctional adenosylcobinamide kinase/adenosylcobinamide-phosphate guanylyltransferase [Candidatus Limnocylindria bacterium]